MSKRFFRPLLLEDGKNITSCSDYGSCASCTDTTVFDCSWCATDNSCVTASSSGASCAAELLGSCHDSYYTIIFLIVVAVLLCLCCAMCYCRRLQRMHHEHMLQAWLSPLLPQRARQLLFRNSYSETNEPEWMCIICGFDNKPRSAHCTMCGTSHEFSIEYKGQKIEQRKQRFEQKQRRAQAKKQLLEQQKLHAEQKGDEKLTKPLLESDNDLESADVSASADQFDLEKQFQKVTSPTRRKQPLTRGGGVHSTDDVAQLSSISMSLKFFQSMPAESSGVSIQDPQALLTVPSHSTGFHSAYPNGDGVSGTGTGMVGGIEPLSANLRTQALNFRRMNQLSLRQKSARRRKMWQRSYDEKQQAMVWMRVPVKETKVGSSPFGYTPGNSFAESRYDGGTSMSCSIRSSESAIDPLNPMHTAQNGHRPEAGRTSSAVEDLLAAAANPPPDQSSNSMSSNRFTPYRPSSIFPRPTVAERSSYSPVRVSQSPIRSAVDKSGRPRADSFGDAALVSTSPGFTSVFDDQGDLQWQKVVPGAPMPRSTYGPTVARYPLKHLADAANRGNGGRSVDVSVDSKARLGDFLAQDSKFDLSAIAAYTFKEKQIWFLDRMSEMQKPWTEGFVRIEIRRAKLLEDSHRAWSQLRPEDLHKWIRFQFHDEPGIDAGGLEREWFALVVEELFSPSVGLFARIGNSEASGSYHINPISGAINANHLSYFRFAGRVLGKAVMEQQSIKASLSLPLRKQLIAMPVTFSDLEFVDEELYRNLQWLNRNDNVSSLMLDFSISYTAANQTVTYDLIPDGSDIMVTDDNKHEYLQLRLQHRLLDSIKLQLENLMLGFYEVIPPELLSVFDYQELDLLLCGVPDIDLDDWIRHTEYLGEYQRKGAAHPVIKWFWESVRNMSQEERVRLLQFVTGCARLPVQGFKALQSSDGRYRKFNVQSVSKADAIYPRAHTCFNKLDLPVYDSKEELDAFLSVVLTMEVVGFNME